MLILGLDLETTGLDVEKCDIVEIGVAAYAPQFRRIFNHGSILLQCDEMNPETTQIHGIAPEMCSMYGIEPRHAFKSLAIQMEHADYVCGQNIRNYDILVLQNQFLKHEIPFPDIKIIDTKSDLPFPDDCKARSLVHMAADHDIFFPKQRRHGALNDVLVMLEILDHYDIKEVIKRSESPTITIGISVPFDENDFPKSRRYRWNPKLRFWEKTIKQFELEAEQKASKYPIQIL